MTKSLDSCLSEKLLLCCERISFLDKLLCGWEFFSLNMNISLHFLLACGKSDVIILFDRSSIVLAAVNTVFVHLRILASPLYFYLVECL